MGASNPGTRDRRPKRETGGAGLGALGPWGQGWAAGGPRDRRPKGNTALWPGAGGRLRPEGLGHRTPSHFQCQVAKFSSTQRRKH